MEAIIQEIENRTITGKKVKSLRREGITPANIYGHGIESHSIQAETATLKKTIAHAGGTQLITLKNPAEEDRQVLIKRAQKDPLTGELLHVDFHQVSLKDKVKVAVPLIFKGETRASRRNDLVVLENLNSIEVECLPTEIPENITIDISELAEAGDRLLVSDLILDEEITVLTNPDDMLISVSQARAEVEEGEEEAAEAEVTEAGAEEPATTPEEQSEEKPE